MVNEFETYNLTWFQFHRFNLYDVDNTDRLNSRTSTETINNELQYRDSDIPYKNYFKTGLMYLSVMLITMRSSSHRADYLINA